MKSPRRIILKAGALAAAAAVLPSRIVVAENHDGTAFDKAHAKTNASIKAHFSKIGYRPRKPAPIVTRDEAFNGGLRFDDSSLLQKPGEMSFQQCTRIEDIENKHRRDVLPLFHIFSCSKPLGFKSPQTVAQILNFLTNVSGLDRDRLAFVGTPRLNDYLPVLESAKIEVIKQIYLRDQADALKMADGSGYYRFPGTPDAPIQETAGIYYWIGQGAPRPMTSYPPSQDWTEIGEFSVDDNDTLAFALGTERVTLASTGLIATWQERLTQLFEYIENDSSGAKPPSRRAHFSND